MFCFQHIGNFPLFAFIKWITRTCMNSYYVTFEVIYLQSYELLSQNKHNHKQKQARSNTCHGRSEVC